MVLLLIMVFTFRPTYLLIEPKGTLLTHAETRFCQIFDPLKLREDELAGPVCVENLRLASNRSHRYWRLSVRRRHVTHTGRRLRMRIVLSRNRK